MLADRAALATALFALSLLLLAPVGCSSKQSRARAHVESAEAHLAQGRLDDALIELNNALRLDPDDADVAQRIADLLATTGDAAEARFFYGEAYRLDPDRVEAAVKLANIERGLDPDAARQLVLELVENHPTAPWTYIGLAEQALVDSDTQNALEAARYALEIDPDGPDSADAHWELARVHMARIREHEVVRKRAPDDVYESALEELDRFAEADPLRRWRTLDERARILTAWPGHEQEASRATREAAAEMERLGLRRAELSLLERSLPFARRTGDIDLEEWALRRRVEIDPTLFGSWDELAELHELTGRPARAVYRELAERIPDDPRAQIRLARHLARTQGFRAGVLALRKQIDDGADAPPLLAETARLQYGGGNRQAAFNTVSRLVSEYPDAHETAVMAAWRWLESGRPDLAVSLLEDPDVAGWVADDAGAMRVLVDAHMRQGDAAASRKALERLLELTPEPGSRLLRIYAQTLLEDGEPLEARRVYSRLQQNGGLIPIDQARYAIALYETGAGNLGRRLLETLVDSPRPPRLAVTELFQREGVDPAQVMRLRRGFARALAVAPGNRRLLAHYVSFQIAAGTPEAARPQLEAAVAARKQQGRKTGTLDLLRVAIERASGHMGRAREIALEVLEAEPTLDAALPTAVSLYPTAEDARAGIAALTQGLELGELSAARQALLGRLYYRAGQPVQARWAYEQALSKGLELPILKNDLAFLLAHQGKDLQRAQLLARQAVRAMPNEAGAIDTLGYVLLESDEAQLALKEFQRALEAAKASGAPQADIYFHLGLAFAELKRIQEAESAFETALAASDELSDVARARRELARVRGDI